MTAGVQEGSWRLQDATQPHRRPAESHRVTRGRCAPLLCPTASHDLLCCRKPSFEGLLCQCVLTRCIVESGTCALGKCNGVGAACRQEGLGTRF